MKSEFWSKTETHIFIITVLWLIFVFFHLGEGTLLDGIDDIYYAYKAKEMLIRNDWITMYYEGRPSFDNVPGGIWLIALSFKLFRISEFSARLPSALFFLATVLLVYFFAKRVYNWYTGFISAFVLFSTPIFLKYSGRAMIDVTLTFFVTAALFSFYLAQRKSCYYLLWGLFTGISILIKSILGIFPLVIGLVYFLLSKKTKKLLEERYIWIAIILTALISLPWYLHQYFNFGKEFLNEHFGWLIMQRAFESKEHYPWYEYFGYFKRLVKSYWIWLPVACLGIVRIFREWLDNKEQHTSLLIAWIVTILGLLSITKTKVSWYIMPVYPALAIVSGYRIGLWLNEIKAIRIVKWFSIISFVCGLFMLHYPVHRNKNPDIKELAPIIKKELSENEGIISYKLSDWKIRTAFWFYTDHGFEYPVEEKIESFVDRMNSEKKKIALCRKEDYQIVLNSSGKNWSIIRETKNLILFTNTNN